MSDDEKSVSEVPVVSAESIGAVEDMVRDAGLEDLYRELADRGITPEQARDGLRRVIEHDAAVPAEILEALDLSADGDI